MLFQTNLYADPYMMNNTAASSAAAGIGLLGSLFYLAFFVVYVVALVKIFQKAGREWWEAIIPIYNTYVMIKIAGRPGWWLLLFLIPIANIVALVIVMNDLSKAFGHGVGFTLGLIFFSVIFLLILGFGSSQYKLAGVATAGTSAPAPSAPVVNPEPAPMPTEPMNQTQS